MEACKVVERFGLDPNQFTETECLSMRHGHRIWRVNTGEGTKIIKWFPDRSSAAVEIGSYNLLRELGIPTLQVYGVLEDALLLEDLSSSVRWRPASENDVAKEEVGAAVGRWYKTFHQSGSEFLQQGLHGMSFLKRETASLNAQAVDEAARALGLVDNPVWKVVADSLNLLKHAESSLGVTLCYNDFHWSNLALTREGSGSVEAVVYDYHLLGVGMPYSDYRNVIGSLGLEAAAAFRDEYGYIDPRESVIDKPLSTIYTLVVASRLPRFTHWAQESRDAVMNGGLLRDIHEAIVLAEEIL